MAVKYPDILEHNNPILALVDADFIRGGGRVVADTTALYALSSRPDQLKENVTEVFVISLGYKMRLSNAAQAGNSSGWSPDATPITVDPTPTSGSTNPVSSGGVYTALQGYASLTGSYSNPAWITSLAWSKITGTPTTYAGYGLPDPAPATGSTAYIQNQFTSGQTANMWITGTVQSNIVYSNSIAYPQAANSANILFATTGVEINRNINDANSIAKVRNLNASSTGDLLQLFDQSTLRFFFTKSGIFNISTTPTTSGTDYAPTVRNRTSGALEIVTPTALSSATAATAAGTNTYTATLAPSITALTTNMVVTIKFTNANTAAATLNLNGTGAIAITKNGTTALVSGDITANSVHTLLYDGTRFIIADNIPTAITAASTSDVNTGTDTTRFINSSLLAYDKTQARTITAKWAFPTLKLTPQGSTPSGLTNGDLWYETTNSRLRLQETSQLVDVVKSADNYLFAGANNRLLQSNSMGDLSATQEIAEGFVTDTDVITAITGATYNSANNYTATVSPANSKTLYQGQWYKTGGDLYFAVDDNIVYKVSRIPPIPTTYSLEVFTNQVSSVNGAEITPYTYTLPANTLTTDKQMIEYEFVVLFNSISNVNRTLAVRINGANVRNYTATVNGASMSIKGCMVRTSSTGLFSSSTATFTPAATTASTILDEFSTLTLPSLGWGQANTITFSMQNGTATAGELIARFARLTFKSI